jgi:hypothetical protein
MPEKKLYRLIQRGLFHPVDLSEQRGRRNNGILIRESALIYFAWRLKSSDRPKWFNPNTLADIPEDAKTCPTVLAAGVVGDTPFVAPLGATKPNRPADYQAPTGPQLFTDLESARIAELELKVAKAEIENRIARNELIELAPLKSWLAGVAVEVRQALLSLPPRLGARLASVTDHREATEILTQEITEALRTLSDLKEKYDV